MAPSEPTPNYTIWQGYFLSRTSPESETSETLIVSPKTTVSQSPKELKKNIIYFFYLMLSPYLYYGVLDIEPELKCGGFRAHRART